MDAANEMNNAKAFNMIVLGGLLKLRPVVTLENVVKGLKKGQLYKQPIKSQHGYQIFRLEKGMELIREV